MHVRCAVNKGLILSNEDMQDSRIGEWDCKIFCDKHTKIGKKKLHSIKEKRDRSNVGWKSKKIIQEDDNLEQRMTRAVNSNPRVSTGDLINQINIDRILEESFNETNNVAETDNKIF